MLSVDSTGQQDGALQGPGDDTLDCPELARDPSPLLTIGNDLAAIGIVDESDSAKLVYLAYTSRVLEDPAAIVARGVRGTGKSVLLTKTATLFPPRSRLRRCR